MSYITFKNMELGEPIKSEDFMSIGKGGTESLMLGAYIYDHLIAYCRVPMNSPTIPQDWYISDEIENDVGEQTKVLQSSCATIWTTLEVQSRLVLHTVGDNLRYKLQLVK